MSEIVITSTSERLEALVGKPIYLDVFGWVRFVKDSDFAGARWKVSE